MNNIQPSQKIENASEYLSKFPDYFKGIESIEKQENPKAIYTLVHIMQRHTHKDIDETYFKMNAKINNVQKIIYEMLVELKNRGLADHIYSEGLFFTPEKKPKGPFRLRYVQENIDDYYAGSQRITPENIHKVVNDLYQKFSYGGEYYPGAEFKLSLEGLIDLRPADDFVAFAEFKTAEAWMKFIKDKGYNFTGISLEEYYSFMTDKREDAVLKNIMGITKQKGEVYGLLSYGSAHRFDGHSPINGVNYDPWNSKVDNIAKWNEQNPTEQIQLIKVLPQGAY